MLGRRPGAAQVLRHIHTYAATILDRVFLLSGSVRRFDVRVQGHALQHVAARQHAAGLSVLKIGPQAALQAEYSRSLNAPTQDR